MPPGARASKSTKAPARKAAPVKRSAPRVTPPAPVSANGAAAGTAGGWRAPTRQLDWPEGHFLHGLEARVRLVSLGELRQFEAERIAAERGKGDIEKVMIGQLAAVLVDWNFTDDQGPVPPIEDQFHRAPIEVLTALWSRWHTSIGKVPDPLPVPSSASARSTDMERSLPMEIL